MKKKGVTVGGVKSKGGRGRGTQLKKGPKKSGFVGAVASQALAGEEGMPIEPVPTGEVVMPKAAVLTKRRDKWTKQQEKREKLISDTTQVWTQAALTEGVEEEFRHAYFRTKGCEEYSVLELRARIQILSQLTLKGDSSLQSELHKLNKWYASHADKALKDEESVRKLFPGDKDVEIAARVAQLYEVNQEWGDRQLLAITRQGTPTPAAEASTGTLICENKAVEMRLLRLAAGIEVELSKDMNSAQGVVSEKNAYLRESLDIIEQKSNLARVDGGASLSSNIESIADSDRAELFERQGLVPGAPTASETSIGGYFIKRSGKPKSKNPWKRRYDTILFVVGCSVRCTQYLLAC
jgi:hypothetical protein